MRQNRVTLEYASIVRLQKRRRQQQQGHQGFGTLRWRCERCERKKGAQNTGVKAYRNADCASLVIESHSSMIMILNAAQNRRECCITITPSVQRLTDSSSSSIRSTTGREHVVFDVMRVVCGSW